MKIAILAVTLFFATSIAMAQPPGSGGEPTLSAGVPIYGISANGELRWYFHQGAYTGSATWANRGQGKIVGSGWAEGLRVFKADPHGMDGIIYRVDSRGDLLWYRHHGRRTGSTNWEGPKNVGNGWQGMKLAFGASDGIIYAIDKNGDLLWYRHQGREDGRYAWANGGNGAKVGTGWGGMRLVFAGGKGVIYAIDPKGDLYWYRHVGHTQGTFDWANGATGKKVGSGWNEVASAFSGGDGIIYALKRDGNLYWYNHTGFGTGAATWTTANGNRIGTGWGGMVRIF